MKYMRIVAVYLTARNTPVFHPPIRTDLFD